MSRDEGPTIEVVCAPRGFTSRGEFQPRAPAREPGVGKVWLPLAHPFGPRLTPAAPGSVPGGAADPIRRTLERYGVSPGLRARENLASLEREGARLVITGQQPGFLTGPLYTVYKAVTACAAAAHLESVTGIRHVPVFWVASEDHDLDEARSAFLPRPDGTTAEFALPHPQDRRPLSDYPFDRTCEEVLERALAHLEGRRHSAEARALAEEYRGRDLAGGFAALLTRLLEPRGLLTIDPRDLRSGAVPLIRRCIEEPRELLARIQEGIAEVEALGIEAQVPGRFPLFLLEGGKRHHLAPEDPSRGGISGRFQLEGIGKSIGSDELLSILGSEPERFSPGVLLRPAVQNALLGNAVYIGGPAEIAYFAQLRPLFEWFGLPPPGIALRLSATLIEGKVARALRRLGLWPAPAGAERFAQAKGPEDLLPPQPGGPDSRLRTLSREVRERILEALKDPRIPWDSRRRLEEGAARIALDIARLGERAARAARPREGEDLLAASTIFRNFFPDGVLQERRWNILYYISKSGVSWIEELTRALARDPFLSDHRWISLGLGDSREGDE